MKDIDVNVPSERPVKNQDTDFKWYVKLTRFMCYSSILLWSVSLFISLLGLIGRSGYSNAYFVGYIFGISIAIGVFIGPLLLFLTVSKNPVYDKYQIVIACNIISGVFVCGLSAFVILSNEGGFNGTYIFFAILYSIPYFLNSYSCIKLANKKLDRAKS